MLARQFRGRRLAALEALEGPPAPFFFGPRLWFAGEGAWAAAAGVLKGWPGPLGLVGEAGLLRTFRRGISEAWLEQGVVLRLLDLPDGVECAPEAWEGLEARARESGVGGLIALGGGRVLDLAKLAARALKVPLAAAPTSAATCACATAVAVVNGADGSFGDVVDLGGPADLCVVENAVLRGAPPRLLAAGLADTLAKWLEWRAVEEAPAGFGAGAGWALAQRAASVCTALGAEALDAPGSPAFDAVLEACLLGSAAASCAGSAPAAAAHSLANALSRQAPGRALLHGEAVGLGLLWQETLLAGSGRATMEPGALGALLASWRLPTRLPPGLDARRLIRDAQAAGESVHSLGPFADPEGALDSLLKGP